MSRKNVGLASRSAKSVPADGCHADFDFVLMSSSSAEGLKRYVGYVGGLPCMVMCSWTNCLTPPRS